jgi:aminoglycoside phosphotransferase (APT) family kinase protein
MSRSSPAAASALDDCNLRSFVETSAVQLIGDERHVVEIERKLNDYHSSFAIEELTVTFDDATQLPLIFKNLSPDGLLDYARQIRPQFSYHPIREIAVYREILAGSRLGTASCYGALIDEKRQRYWLLLEKVAGHELAKTGSFSIWCQVAQWLADIHYRMADVAFAFEKTARLTKYDENAYAIWAARAEHFCGMREHMADRLAPPGIKWLVDQCRLAVQQLCRLPNTLIHGEFYASNVLINRTDNHVRICAIDWETAAIGPGILDLAALVAGKWTEQQKVDLAMAYYNALPDDDSTYKSPEELLSVLRCARLFMAIKWLGWSSDWQAPDEHRSDWLAEAMRLAPTIESGQTSFRS